LASCAYDGRVLIFKEQNGAWSKIHENNKHTASGKIKKMAVFCLLFVFNSSSFYWGETQQSTPLLGLHTSWVPF
jgi:hypothetical protein